MKHVTTVIALLALATNAALADPIADLKAANAKLAAMKSYRTTTIEPGGRTIKGETVNPDRSEITEGPVQMISIGDTSYMKMGGGAWQKQASSGMSAGTQSPLKLYGTLPPTAVVHDLGMKTVDGASLHAYSVEISPSYPPSTMYIDANGLPVRIEVMGPRGKLVVTYYDFNAPISIEAPI